MARVPYLNREDLPEADREIFDNLAAERGSVGNIFRTLAHTPKLLRRFLALGGELRNGTALDPKLRELAIMTVGRLTNAEYEFVHHWNLARRAGVPREKLEAETLKYAMACSYILDANKPFPRIVNILIWAPASPAFVAAASAVPTSLRAVSRSAS